MMFSDAAEVLTHNSSNTKYIQQRQQIWEKSLSWVEF